MSATHKHHFPIRLIVGLGNEGAQYLTTRHNAGFWFVDTLADSMRVAFRSESKFFGSVTSCVSQVWLLKPATLMNRSGQAVASFARFYRLDPQEILLVHDELDLNPGQLRLKQQGGHGGHNGLRDVFAHLGTQEIPRLRIGIGHPGHRDGVAQYVLHHPSREDRAKIDLAIDRALQELPTILKGDWHAAMRVLHTQIQ